MNPKLSIGTWAFAFGPFEAKPWSFTQILQYAQRAGYDGVEVNGFLPHPVPELYRTTQQRNQLRDEISSYGLGVSAYAPDFRSVPPAVAKKQDYLDLFKSYAEFANDLGTNLLRVDSVSPPDAFRQANNSDIPYWNLVECWRSAAEVAADAGLRVVWEFEPGFWLNKPSEVLQTVKDINHPAFQVLFDTSHAYMSGVVGARQEGDQELVEQGIEGYARLLEGYIGHFHLIDSDGTLHDEETSTHAHFEEGLIDFKDFLRSSKHALKPLEWWCVDYCFNAEVESWGLEAISYIRKLLKETEQ
jgi:sugar phosphate isomerase/epimerase